MPEPPRRKRLQIHLSTALILMIAAGGMMGLNMVPNLVGYDSRPPVDADTDAYVKTITRQYINDGIIDIEVKQINYGWPALASRRLHFTFQYYLAPKQDVRGPTQMWWKEACINLIVALSILFTIWFVCEWWIRRRAASTKLREGK